MQLYFHLEDAGQIVKSYDSHIRDVGLDLLLKTVFNLFLRL